MPEKHGMDWKVVVFVASLLVGVIAWVWNDHIDREDRRHQQTQEALKEIVNAINEL